MAVGNIEITGYMGPGGGLKAAFGTCTVGDTVESHLTRVENAFLTYSDARSASDAILDATSINSTPGSFVVGGEAGATVFWWAFGY